MFCSTLTRLFCAAFATLALGACTDDISLLDALPGTWRLSNGDLVTFTRSDSSIREGDQLYQGRVVMRGGGIVDLLAGSSSCRGVSEIGLLWAVEDTSLYGNMAFATDPNYRSASASPDCQSTGNSLSYPVIETGARSFTIGTPEIDFLGIPAGELETFTAEALFIDEGLSAGDIDSQLELIELGHEVDVDLSHQLDLRDLIRPLPVSE
ncbi:MAG: hypothetical protein AB8H86_15500 [Polyangiales bacterium]